MDANPDTQTPFLSFGFRPFFLLAGLYSIIAMLAWITWLMLHGANAIILSPTIAVPAHLWHGHEMLFGYTGAVITGFMLTAVPGWTGARRVAGLPLAVLIAVWIAGRIAMWFSTFLPASVVAGADMAHLALLAAIIGRGLMQRPAPRNLIFLVLLLVLIIANGAVHGEWMGLTEDTASWGLALAIITVTLLIVILGGRIVPSFTRNAIIREGGDKDLPRSIAFIDITSIASVVALLACYILDPLNVFTGVFAAIAAASNLIRLSFWKWQSTLDKPILWCLHLAYLWLPAGLAVLATSILFGWFSQGAALHLLAVGAIGGMTMAMITRAPLGHTGRPLIVTRPIAVAYVMIAIAALLRGFALDAWPDSYFAILFIAGSLWVAGFIVFVAVYTPILIGPSLKHQ